jgi:hypothetical protein
VILPLDVQGCRFSLAGFHEKASIVKPDAATATTVRFGYPCHAAGGEGTESVQARWQRLGEVFNTIEQERQRADEDLRRLTAAAVYLRALFPPSRRLARRGGAELLSTAALGADPSASGNALHLALRNRDRSVRPGLSPEADPFRASKDQ